MNEDAYDALIWNASQQGALVPFYLLKAQVWQESRFDAGAVSRSGAMGLLQLMPATAKDLGVAHPFDPSENLDAGARYLRSRYDVFQGEEPTLERWRFALAAYNAGTGYVLAAQKLAVSLGVPSDRWCVLAGLMRGVKVGGLAPDWPQVLGYVSDIVDRWNHYERRALQRRIG